MLLTAENVRNVEFANAPRGRRGYAKNEVDAFVRRIAGTLSQDFRSSQEAVTATEVHRVQFGRPLIGKRGYDEREVDEFLDAVEEHLLNRQ